MIEERTKSNYKKKDKNIDSGFKLAGAIVEFIELQCHRCEYKWNYSGKNKFKATCPHCATSIAVQKFLQAEYEKRKEEEDRKRISELAKVLAEEIVQKIRKAEKEEEKE